MCELSMRVLFVEVGEVLHVRRRAGLRVGVSGVSMRVAGAVGSGAMTLLVACAAACSGACLGARGIAPPPTTT